MGPDCHCCRCWIVAADLLLLHLQEMLLQEEEEQEGQKGDEKCYEHEGYERPGENISLDEDQLGNCSI